MPPRRTPKESFFDRIADRVLDQLDEILEPHLDGIAEIVTRTVEAQVRQGGGGQGQQSRPQSPPRQERTRTRRQPRDPGMPPPPPPPRSTPPPASRPTLYDDLQVTRHADPETIRAAFKALAGKYHPDNQTTGNLEKARRVIEAYEVLGDAARRKAYDRTLPR